MGLVDNRQSSKDLAAGSRKKFIDRYKHKLKKQVDEIGSSKSIKKAQGGRVTIDGGIQEHHIGRHPEKGIRRQVFTGNKKYVKGDIIKRKDGSSGEGGASDQGGGEDSFSFVLSKEEFLDIYFGDLELPNFVKKSFKGDALQIRKRAGVTPVGPPPRLNYKKTIFQHLIRQVATSGKPDPEIGLDPIDLRYNKYTYNPVPNKKAVMFCVMDVSGSMGEHEKTIAKKFYTLLYLFLEKSYKAVDVIFIRHAEEAKEVDEETFFHSREAGGTVVSTGLSLVNEIIKERYTANDNIYLAQASDGDNFPNDNIKTIEQVDLLLPQLQYFAYIQTGRDTQKGSAYYVGTNDTLLTLYQDNFNEDHFVSVQIDSPADVFSVFKNLFAKEKA